MTDTAITIGNFVRLQTLADGTPRVLLDLECSISEIAQFDLKPGAAFAIARIEDSAALKADQKAKSPYGDAAQALYRSSFFRREEVWRAVGSDDSFRAWLRTQKCFACPQTEGVEAAHVRSVAAGSGTGIKPEYSSIPLCKKCHNIIQHQQGICRLTEKESISDARDVLQSWRVQALLDWCWSEVKLQLAVESMKLLPPGELFLWAQKRCVNQYLPTEYRQ